VRTPVEPIESVMLELTRATQKFGPFASAHEGFAVILEEVDELREAVWHGTRREQRAEAVQVAAMAIRFLMDVPEQGEGDREGEDGDGIDRLEACPTGTDERVQHDDGG